MKTAAHSAGDVVLRTSLNILEHSFSVDLSGFSKRLLTVTDPFASE